MTAALPAALPWDYDVRKGQEMPPGIRLLRVTDIAFTQKQVNDSFSHEQRPILELIESVLSGAAHPRDIPLIRVAWHQGQFWAIDNRRLFCYKHCRLERLPVEVIRWEDQHEFEMKWRNGQGARGNGGYGGPMLGHGGHQAGVVQRLKDLPFPRSPIMHEEESEISLFMDEDSQRRHDKARMENLLRYRKMASYEDQLAGDVGRPWKYLARLGEDGMPCTLLKAKVDGLFEACVWNGREVLLHLGLHCGQLEPAVGDCRTAELPLIKKDMLSRLTFVMPHRMPAKLPKPWCAVCGKLVSEKLKQHEASRHASCFACSCGKRFECSEDLRRHSRKQQHAIPQMFRPADTWPPAESSDSDAAPERPDPAEVSSAQHTARPVPRTAPARSAAAPQRRPLRALGNVEGPTFVVAAGSSSRAPANWPCPICQAVVLKLREHERQEHPGCYRCASCGKSDFTCSEDLRRHARKKGHAISQHFEW
ncbi:unnamed protein product [Durusdinium trenchii]|uniref:C2H2-type domain-containing protein n=2 Tax=Durusdinium trenchii TaxID=1381693 RepID=A0ABP0PAT9_9DINO